MKPESITKYLDRLMAESINKQAMEFIDETKFFKALCNKYKDLKHISIEWQEDNQYYLIMAIKDNKPCSIRMSKHEKEFIIKDYETKSTKEA